ncbi:inter-alpha-trypsin inhibitor heavy chain H3-like isoform X1 [Xiphophorus hellerii]|uniref:inter-alpha-trypsin inhibitor heavy chain H3-like isoform X1 n=1 Tax=Xiphophorus hellerii TaxID=8084 RepID=UPI0013B3712D|nr:inter-alpha-trypsin inhibitor heavy chain H3-like isoform X1 [Xiphophorus hellerii]
MGRASVLLTVFGLLLALTASLPNKDDWDIYSFHINSTVTSRYATTVITSRVANRMNEPKEIEFHVQIPKNAFISRFRMMMDGQVYDGVVKTKEQAQEQYTRAVSRGQSAGIVRSVGRTMEEFKTSVTVAAHKKVTFELTYEELLKRTHGKYELQIYARPMKPVEDFKADVHIHEKAGVSFVDVKGGLSTKALANAITKTHADKQAWVHFYPTVDQQKNCDSCGEEGMNGDLVIAYDVNRDNGFGDIKTSDGYFIHHFAPSSLPRIPKNVVFVIDRSGSMHGRKITQTRTALLRILNDLAEDDFFGLISFDGEIIHFKRELVQATALNLEGARGFVRNIEDRGSTDINAAVLEGARILNEHPREGSASILILLTDGDPTSGVTNFDTIQSNVKQAIAGKFPLYCLGFGFDVKFEFLEKMSLQNNGVARRIYEDSDADLQLKGFYDEVATPLLTDITMIYVGGTNLTKTNFSQYYNGSEIVVAGEIIDNNVEIFTPQVVAISSKQKVTFSNTNGSVDSSVSDGLLQRVWAYLTVKQLLEKELLLSGPEKEKVNKEALELSLTYGFVTPLTSMVVTKPEGESSEIHHKPKEREEPLPQTLHRSPMRSYDQRRRFIKSFSGGSASLRPRTGTPFEWKPFVYGDSSTRRYRYPPLAPVSHRFLMKTVNDTHPLCFDIIGAVIVKLLHHPGTELYINGELDSIKNGGFKEIVIHVGADFHIKVEPERISLQQGQNITHYTRAENVTAGRFTVNRIKKQTEVTDGDMRLVILVHEKHRRKFLWPVLRQLPSAGDTEGLLALNRVQYEEVHQDAHTKVKTAKGETDAQRSTAVDLRIRRPVEVGCWLIPADFVLPRPLTDFLVAHV